MANNNVNFSASYSRRPPAQAPAPPKLSLLGDPPISRGGGGGVPRQQQQQQQQSGGGGGGKGHGHGQGQSYGNYGYDAGGADDYRKKAKFEEEYDMMMDEFNEFHDKVEPPGSDSRGAIDYERMERDRGCGGSRWSQNSPGGGRRPQDRQDFNRGGGDDMPVGRHRNPSWTTREDRDYDEPLRMSNQGPGQGQFNQQPNFGASNLNQQFHNPAQNLQGLGLNAMVGQQQQNQQLLNLQSGLLGMMPMNSAQNALSLFQQQQQLAAAAAATAANPMQLLLGNLPAFNSGALGKQILNAAAAAASGGGNPFGPGLGMGNRNMPQPLMGIRTDDSFDKRSFVDRNASSRSRPQQRGRSPVPRNRDAGRVDRKRPGDRYFDHDHKRARSGRDEDKSKVLRTSISSTGSGRSGNRKSEHQGKKKGDKDKGPAKDDKSKDKDKVKGEPGTEKDEVKEETKEGDATEATEEEGADKKSESTDAKEKDKSKEKEKDKSKEKEKEEKRKSRYEEFPASLLVCKVCQKTMNDGSSFESHLTGRAHKALLDIIKQRFLKRADLLMAESKLAEDELGVEMDRQKRAGKSGSSGNKGKNFCKMCDCTYTVNWGAHKAGIHHRVLKEFLHPTCRLCDAQFVHRMDWCNHLLGVAHMKKLAELKAAGKDLFEHESTHQDELFALSIEIGQDEHVSNCVTVRNLDWKVPLKDDLKELLRDDMDIPDGEIMIPDKYDETVAVGEEAIMSTVGYCCKVCKIYMTRESDIEPHLKDKSHFGMYTNFLRKVVRYREDLRRREEAKAKGEPEVLDEKHLKIEILGADDGADHDNDNDDDDAKTEIIGAIKEEGVKKEEIKEEMTESELLKDNENDEEMASYSNCKDELHEKELLAESSEDQTLKICNVFTLQEEEAETVVNDQKMETETKVDGESQGDNVNGGEIEGEEAVKIVVEEVAEAVKPVGRGKTPPKSDAAATTVTLKPVVQKVAATPTPSRNRAVRGGRGGRGGTPAGARGGGATPGRGGGAPQSAGRGGAGPRGTPRGGLAMRGKPGGAARGGFPRADR